MPDKIKLQENCRQLSMALRNLMGALGSATVTCSLADAGQLTQAIEQADNALNNHSAWLLSDRE